MENNVNDKEIPLITVITDGTWSKISYKNGYNALFGVVRILSDSLNIVFRSIIIHFV
jgi:hypothetical protein